MNAAAGQRVEVDRERGDERLAFARLHLRDLAAVQHHAAHQLNVEVAHVQDPLAALAADGEGLGEQFVERELQVFLRRLDGVLVERHFLLHGVERFDDGAEALAELLRLAAELVIGEAAHLRFQRVDLLDDREHPLDVALVLRAENRGQYFVDHELFLSERDRCSSNN